ncbi:MAG TPA: sigma-70 family RNA polymerase sigma factor [Mycobacteriales bacterium]|nr:sigma-70 family RNA polymerase sigma factor [Mycobacteriales bacterium]
MTALSRPDPVLPELVIDDDDWFRLLSAPGPGHEEALRRLHQLLLRAARHQVTRMQARLGPVGSVRVDDIVHQAADEAMVSLLGKLSTFEGRSRFTTWAYKFGILQASVEVNRHLWRHRDVPLHELTEPSASDPTPEQVSEAAELSTAVRRAIAQALTPHQRTVAIALLVDEVPIDVLAERLGTTRNALYKTLHDARVRLRRELDLRGYDLPMPRREQDR